MMKYRINHQGNYILTNNGEDIAYGPHGLPEIAVAFTKTDEMPTWTLHKHGEPEIVKSWLKQAKENLSSLLGPGRDLGIEMANELTMVSGKFQIDEINKVLSTTGYIKQMIQNHERTIDI